MWMRKRWVTGALCLAMLAACSGDDPGTGPIESGEGAASPEEAVEELFDLLATGDFADAASLAIPGQAALASLAEGASFPEVAEAMSGDAVVAANFWSGFAQSVEGVLTQGVEATDTATVTREDLEFHIVDVSMPDGDVRHVATRDVDGYRIDLFATFGPSLAGRLYPQAELLFQDDSAEASTILSGLREQVPSLYIATQIPNLAPNVVQDLLQLIELITRIN